jgi:hypothetical protein
MSLLLAGWLWQLVGTLREDVQRLQDSKADRQSVESKAGDRWTGAQQTEYRLYVDSRFQDINSKMDVCREQLEQDMKRMQEARGK